MRIIHMTPTANGAPWMVAFLIEQKKLGHEVRAIISGGDGDIAPKLDAAGIPYDVLSFSLLGARSAPGTAVAILRCALLLRRLRPDIVQTHIFEATIIGRLASWLADVPVSISMIPGPLVQEVPLLRAIDLGTEFADHKIVASCEYTRTLYLENGVDPAKLEMIYYAVDQSGHHPELADGDRVRREFGIPAGVPVVGYVAYYYAPLSSAVAPPHLANRSLKGHEVFIRAMPHVLAEFPAARFMLVGRSWLDTAQFPQHIYDLVRELGIEHAVIFAGERKDVPDVIASFDISVHCSLSDNLGGTVESLLMAKPMAVSDIGGFRDTVIHGKTGLTFPAGDHEALAAALTQLMRDPGHARVLGEAGRAWMLERFMLPRSIADLEELYARCASERTGGRDVLPRKLGYRLGVSLGRFLGLPFKLLPVAREIRRTLGPRLSLSRRLLIATLRSGRNLLRRNGRPIEGAVRVAQVIGAAENCQWAVDLSSGLEARGRNVIAVIDSAEGSLGRRMEQAGVRVERMPMVFAASLDRLRWVAYVTGLPLAVLRLARILRRERVDIVQSHIFPSILVARIAAWLAGSRHIAMVSSPRHLEARLTRMIERRTWWLDEFTVAGCSYTADIYTKMGLPEERAATAYYGGDPAHFDPSTADGNRVRQELGIEADAPVVTIVANFYPPVRGVQAPLHTRGVGLKGHEHFLAAARIVSERFPSARFLVVGCGVQPTGEAYRRALEHDVKDNPRLASRVIFTGQRTDVRDVLAATDVAVQCSLTETLGGTIEALLMARPTVVTRVGGMPEAVRHEQTGLLVPPADPEALAAAILRLLEDPDAAARYGAAGRSLMLTRFTMERTIEDVDRLIGRAAGARA